jgi:arabinan endo-1,5-alpha-L-arabinosidase
VDETYYCFYCISKTGFQGSKIGLATSPSMDVGSWTDYGAIDLPMDEAYNLIDPNLFRKSTDDPFLFTFGSSWQDIYQTTLDSSLTTQASGASPQQIAYNSTISPYTGKPPVVEGAYQWWWPDADGNPLYYLFFSSGACCATADGTGELAPAGEEYKVMVCRSDSPTGPWVDQDGTDCLSDNGGTLILGSHDNVYAPGGQSVFHDAASDRIVMVYHYVNPEIGYLREQFQFGFNYLDFSSGWPVVVE